MIRFPRRLRARVALWLVFVCVAGLASSLVGGFAPLAQPSLAHADASDYCGSAPDGCLWQDASESAGCNADTEEDSGSSLESPDDFAPIHDGLGWSPPGQPVLWIIPDEAREAFASPEPPPSRRA